MAFKWKTPQDWLVSYLKGLSKEGLLREAMILASKLDDDQVQEEYESLMDNDGYFEEIGG